MPRNARQLPTDRTPFIGRARELATLRQALAEGARLLTITGPSGTGKTRLARQLARDAAADGGAVHFLGLGAGRSPADLAALVAQALGLAQQPGAELAESLAGLGPLLLVLDNVDPGAASLGEVIGGLLDRCPELELLVTCLVPLGVRGEVRFELGPLDEADAIALYEARVRDAWADRTFTAPEHEAIGELVRRLDRLPLAIELAAARIRVLPPRQLLERIAQRLDLLRTDEPGPHGSLAGALSLSWNLLDEEEQAALAAISIFAGGFTLDEAEAIVGSPRLVDALEGLRDKALLQLEGDRFSLYESVREFAAVRLREQGRERELHVRHARHFAERGLAEADRAYGPAALEAARWLGAERENLLAAHRRSFATEPALSARAGIALAFLLVSGGLVAREAEIFDGTVQAARRADDRALLAHALWARVRWHKRQQNGPAARRDIEEGLELARACGDRRREGYLLVEEGAIGVPAAEPGARGALETALAIGREVGDTLLEGHALMVLGALEESLGELDRCAARLEQALAIFRSGGHHRFRGVALLNLGAILSHRGRFSAARQALDEARAIFASQENLVSMTYAVINLGSLALSMGELEEAEARMVETLGLERRCGNPQLRAVATGTLGMIALERGDVRDGERRLVEGIALLRELGVTRHLATLLPFHAAAIAVLGRIEEARAELNEARAIFDGGRDEASLRMLSLLEGCVDLGEARLVAQGLRGGDAAALEARARSRLGATADDPGGTVEGVFVARRLLQQALARRPEPDAPPAPLPEGALVVGPEAAFFVVGAGERVDLRRRTAIRRILRGLVENRLLAPGMGASADELAAIGWPGEKILPSAAATRVWSAIRTLRSLGLGTVLLRHADGYLLDPELPVVRGGTADVA